MDSEENVLENKPTSDENTNEVAENSSKNSEKDNGNKSANFTDDEKELEERNKKSFMRQVGRKLTLTDLIWKRY